ncbi:MAG: hypothetical protein QM676_14345 [Novosphingobium sp.]
MAQDELRIGADSEQSKANLRAGIVRLHEALELLDGAEVPLANSYVHLAIHMCLTELKTREE